MAVFLLVYQSVMALRSWCKLEQPCGCSKLCWSQISPKDRGSTKVVDSLYTSPPPLHSPSSTGPEDKLMGLFQLRSM